MSSAAELLDSLESLRDAAGGGSRATGPSAAVPSYPDRATELLSQRLDDAYARKRALESAGVNTDDVVREILELKREIRQGGQLRAGDRLKAGRYLLLDPIGRGGFSTVWTALDQKENRRVAVKVLHSEIAGDIIRRDRFFRGARIMKELTSEAVVRVLDPRGEDGGYYFFVMELLGGGDLQRAVTDQTLGENAVVPVIARIGETLAAAHERGFVHRDVKPTNILLTASGEPRLTDFDLVAVSDSTGGTRTGALGTFLYAAPEMLDRPQDAGPAADVYSLGMTAIFALHGQLPASALWETGKLIAGLGCNRAMKAVLTQAVAKEPDHRFEDMAAFCRALQTATEQEEVDGEELLHAENGSLNLSVRMRSSPRDAGLAFTSIDRHGQLGEATGKLRELGAPWMILVASDDELRSGFLMRDTPAGIPLVCILVSDLVDASERLLRKHLREALSTLSDFVAGRTAWMPLMGTGRGGLSPGESVKITIEAMIQAGLHELDRPTEVWLDLPPELDDETVMELVDKAGRNFDRHQARTNETAADSATEDEFRVRVPRLSAESDCYNRYRTPMRWLSSDIDTKVRSTSSRKLAINSSESSSASNR